MKEHKVKYYLDDTGKFAIENYNHSKPLANFFPGIAGKYGIPMWVFYVNRGQGICSFGTKDKDHAILEFFPANKSWQLVSLYGFRTFLKVTGAKQPILYEPFQNNFLNLKFNIRNKMSYNSCELALEEENLTLGLRIKVDYFNIPNEPYAAMARLVSLRNIGRKHKTIQILDGLPQVVPFGTSNLFLKKLGRTIEAWMKVENLENSAPFYKLAVDPIDRPEVIHIKEGNFYLGFHYDNTKAKLIKPIIDPKSIFGEGTDFSLPQNFLKEKKLISPKNENIVSRMPCAFLPLEIKLKPGEEKEFFVVVGNTRNLKMLNANLPEIIAKGFLHSKRAQNQFLILDLEKDIQTASGKKVFDLYAKQTYLDNILRGGYPYIFNSGEAFYLYSRKHGDLERDYNKFQLQPAYFSQGNGNYRDMNQNRRNDIWFHPETKDENLIYFFNLLQSDGYNPLVIKGISFALKEETDLNAILNGKAKAPDIEKISAFLAKPFTPGAIIFFLEENKIKLNVTYDEFLGLLIAHSRKVQEAEHGEGFWTDHWAYNLDLLENYLAVYPEKFNEIFFEKRVFTFYDNSEVVRPRSEKYFKTPGGIKQLHSVNPDSAKKEMIKKRAQQPHVVRSDYGQGEIYQTSLINKLFCLLVNKLASLDPFGCGIEMEANKPNWFDALNGLPALFGSSICETFELKRLLLILIEAIKKGGRKDLLLSEETLDFLNNLFRLIQDYTNSQSADKDYRYWDNSAVLKEEYRKKTGLGFSGKEIGIAVQELLPILDAALEKIEQGLLKAKENNLYCSYFINEVATYHDLQENLVKPTKFIQKRVAPFLEGQVHALKMAEDIDAAKALYKAVLKSGLYDEKLNMYKVTASLKDEPEEIGRCRAFSPGWLENESVWLHMEYKYLLEMLKRGLYAEFFHDFKQALVPFQDPARYGRSILENSSFIVSSAFADKDLVGNGFVARLSGSTAEFLQMWLIMNAGKSPFFLNEQQQLNLRFEPILAGWLFDRKGDYAFNFLSKVKVTYHNPGKGDTFGKAGVQIKKITFIDKDGARKEIPSQTIPHPYAEQVRSRKINEIEVYLG